MARPGDAVTGTDRDDPGGHLAKGRVARLANFG